MKKPLTSLDLYVGAGGLTLGFQNAGIKCVGAIEYDRFACETFRTNFPNIPLIESDIRKLTEQEIRKKFQGVDIIAGGPPCQGFSVAGPAQYGKIDKRNSLILQIHRFAKILQPKLVIVENVKGILCGKLTKEKMAMQEYVTKMEELGYANKVFVLQAADFGVPQWRERVFIMSASKLEFLPDSITGKFTDNWRTVGDALSDLPLIQAGEEIPEGETYKARPKNEYQRWLRKGSNGIFNHVAMKHTPRLIERFKHIPIGGSLVHVPAEFGQRKRNGTEIDARQRFKMNNQRLDPKKVTTSITASFQSNFVHPSLNRNLTAREGARLQSFPDYFIFKGPRTLMSKHLLKREGRTDEIGLSQYNQIGNAVPPLLAQGVAETIVRKLCSP